jgi:DNA-binding response OmpR family regulator
MAENKKILIVDDDPSVQFVVKKRLQKAGFECESALTVEEGLAHLKSNPPNLIILDLGFAGVDGADFLQSVKRWVGDDAKVPPIIVMSCYNEKDIVDYVIDLGASDFIAKPYDPADLVSTVSEYIQHG